MSDPDQQAPTNPEEPTTGVESEEIVVGADSTAEYQPVVTLQKVETATGEENDEVLYKQRSALYRFDSGSNEWKERGRGDVKFLQNKDSKKVRVLLRQEKTLKCCMNHIVSHNIELVANAGSDRSWTWRTIDYATEEAEQQTFAIRFKDSETATAFKTEYDKFREHNRKLEDGKSDSKADDAKAPSS